MTAQPPVASEPKSSSSRHCPFLGIPGDDTTYYQYPSRTNYCYVPNEPEPIRFEHQEAFCLTADFSRCPVYRVEGATSLPPDIRGKEKGVQTTRNRVGLLVSVLSLGAILALGFFIFGPRFGLNLLSSANSPTRTATPTVERTTPTRTPSLTSSATEIPAEIVFLTATPILAVSPTATKTSTSLPPSLTPLPTHTATQTLIPTQTFTPLPTLTPTYYPSPIPDFGTPYATDPPLVIHLVAEGQSFTYIAELYQTTPEVLTAVNQLIPGQSLWIGLRIVVPIGVTDATGLPHFTVYLNTEDTTLFALAAQFNTTPELIQRYNALGPIPEIPAARYFIIPLP